MFIVLMALFTFWGAEQLERKIGKDDPRTAPKWRYIVAIIRCSAKIPPQSN